VIDADIHAAHAGMTQADQSHVHHEGDRTAEGASGANEGFPFGEHLSGGPSGPSPVIRGDCCARGFGDALIALVPGRSDIQPLTADSFTGQTRTGHDPGRHTIPLAPPGTPLAPLASTTPLVLRV